MDSNGTVSTPGGMLLKILKLIDSKQGEVLCAINGLDGWTGALNGGQLLLVLPGPI